MTSVTCVTSRYLPNLRHLGRLHEADSVVLLDLAPVPDRNRSSFLNRNRIWDPAAEGPRWLSVPVHRQRGLPVGCVSIDYTQHRWPNKHLRSLEACYPRHRLTSPGFLDAVSEVFASRPALLIDLNWQLTILLCESMGLSPPCVDLESAVLATHPVNHRLEITRSVGATTYVAGEVEYGAMVSGGEVELFQQHGIGVRMSPTAPPTLPAYADVVNLSAVHPILGSGGAYALELFRALDVRQQIPSL